MPTIVRFVGAAARSEAALTGVGSSWWPGEVRRVSDARAALLLAAAAGWETERNSDTDLDTVDVPAWIGTWAGKPSAAAVDAGTTMICTDYGVNGRSYWRSDGSLWRPHWKQQIVLAEDIGSAVPDGSEKLLKLMAVPADMLRGANQWRLVVQFTKSGVAIAASSCRVRLGPLGTLSDNTYHNSASLSSTQRQLILPIAGRYYATAQHGPVVMSTLTDVEATASTNGSTTAAPVAITGSDGSGMLYFGFCVTLATETPGVGYRSLWMI